MAEPGVKSARRAMELLEFFAEWRRPASVKEVSQSLGWPQSSTSVLLRALADAGFYDQDARTGMYAPSVRILLATEWIGEQLFSEKSLLRLMEKVHEQTGHTVMIGAQHGVHVRYLHVLQATREGRFTARIGSLRPLFRSATGKMLLTLKPEREIALLLRRANAAETDAARVMTLQDVLREREQARRNGHAVSLGTSEPGAAAVAVLLPVPPGERPMTLSVGGPMRDVVKEQARLLKALQDAVGPIRAAVRQ
ncbi:helix-turn-helix domain-containing protein [Ramlibacter ginsenosidimutans]|uniref:Helix-turn-helix domain-containing protein n=1 Tax=Ramlibacter ginsenosidimutans TaxID=502333 RepID=A0A934TTW1_9BURK|nr:helix-turn-helix domain-containing protein [Ramlibacter ginsenosidimutans]MBK6007298.1 helix-turn-helix domain-containing protein [Ramlibacter ginsenosidimutans]